MCSSDLSATVIMPFTTLTISGTVWDDADGSANNAFTSIQNGSEAGTDAGGIHANLIGSDGKVIASVPVNPNGTYAFSGLNGNQSGLTINLTPVPGTVGLASTAVLPSGWVATSLLTQPAFDLVATSLAAKDFGIEQPPTAQGVDVPGQANPGSTTTVTVPSANFLGTDPEGLVQTYVITAMPTHADHVVISGITYTSLDFPVGGVTIAATAGGFLPTGAIAVDPEAGTVTVKILFKVSDAAGKFSNEEFLYMPFDMITVGGTVWDDANNSAAGTFSNIQNGTEYGANATAAYAILVNSDGNVVASQALAADGTYLFLNVAAAENLTVRLAATAGAVGESAPVAGLPDGWTATSPLEQASFNVASSIVGKDFGIEQLPDSESATAASQANPGGTTSVAVNSILFHGTDPDGTVANIRITAFPSYATSITINGTTYTPTGTTGTTEWPTGGVEVPTNTSGYPTETIAVDPVGGAVSVAITYAAIDNAGKEDSTPGIVTLPFTFISLSGTVFDDANGLTDSTVNGTGTNISGALYVNLIDQNGIAIQEQVKRSPNMVPDQIIRGIKKVADPAARLGIIKKMVIPGGHFLKLDEFRLKRLDLSLTHLSRGAQDDRGMRAIFKELARVRIHRQSIANRRSCRVRDDRSSRL